MIPFQEFDNAFQEKVNANTKLSAIQNRIQAKTATMADMSEYSRIICDLLGDTLGEYITKIPENDRSPICEWLLRNQYEDTNELLATVQQFLDEKQDIHIVPQKAKFPLERVQQVAGSLEDTTAAEEVIRRRAEQAVASVANSFCDDYIKENANFRSNAGLVCHVSRMGAHKCCAWCAEVAGRYVVGSEPKDFWRRHDNCTCVIEYENQKVRQRLSGTGKSWNVTHESQRTNAQKIQYQPTRFSQEQARAAETENLNYKGLTNSLNNGTIKNAAGKVIKIVSSDNVKLFGEPNSITQTTNKKGGINRNYYDENGRQSKQISNNHHNHKAVMSYGKQGEHVHDYIYDENGNLISRPYRELNDEERKENADIL